MAVSPGVVVLLAVLQCGAVAAVPSRPVSGVFMSPISVPPAVCRSLLVPDNCAALQRVVAQAAYKRPQPALCSALQEPENCAAFQRMLDEVPQEAPQAVSREASQVMCPALLEPENCAVFQQVLDGAAQDDALAGTLVKWAGPLVGIRFMVSLMDHGAGRTLGWTTLLFFDFMSVFLRTTVLSLAAVQLVRSWDVSSVLVETRVLLLVVVLDAALLMSRAARFMFFAIARHCEQQLCGCDSPPGLLPVKVAKSIQRLLHRSRSFSHKLNSMLTSPAISRLVFCAVEARSVLRPGRQAGRPHILSRQLLSLVQDQEFLHLGMRQQGLTFLSGPTSALYRLLFGLVYAILAALQLVVAAVTWVALLLWAVTAPLRWSRFTGSSSSSSVP